MPVADLIKKASDSDAGRVKLPAAVVKDLRLVLAANDKTANHKRRVSAEAFMAFVQKEHGLCLGHSVLKRYCTEHLKRQSWGQK